MNIPTYSPDGGHLDLTVTTLQDAVRTVMSRGIRLSTTAYVHHHSRLGFYTGQRELLGVISISLIAFDGREVASYYPEHRAPLSQFQWHAGHDGRGRIVGEHFTRHLDVRFRDISYEIRSVVEEVAS